MVQGLKNFRLTLLATFGVVFVILAPLTGATFLFRDQDNVLIDGYGNNFLLAFTIYLVIFYLVDRR